MVVWSSSQIGKLYKGGGGGKKLAPSSIPSNLMWGEGTRLLPYFRLLDPPLLSSHSCIWKFGAADKCIASRRGQLFPYGRLKRKNLFCSRRKELAAFLKWLCRRFYTIFYDPPPLPRNILCNAMYWKRKLEPGGDELKKLPGLDNTQARR